MIDQNEIYTVHTKIKQMLEKKQLSRIEKILGEYESLRNKNQRKLQYDEDRFKEDLAQLIKWGSELKNTTGTYHKTEVVYVEIINMLRTVLDMKKIKPSNVTTESLKEIKKELGLIFPNVTVEKNLAKEVKLSDIEKERNKIYFKYNRETGKKALYNKKFTKTFKDWLVFNDIELAEPTIV